MAAAKLVFDDPLARDRPPLTATQRSVLRQLRDDAIDERPIDRTQVLVALQAIDQLLAQCDRTRQEAVVNLPGSELGTLPTPPSRADRR